MSAPASTADWPIRRGQSSGTRRRRALGCSRHLARGLPALSGEQSAVTDYKCPAGIATARSRQSPTGRPVWFPRVWAGPLWIERQGLTRHSRDHKLTTSREALARSSHAVVLAPLRCKPPRRLGSHDQLSQAPCRLSGQLACVVWRRAAGAQHFLAILACEIDAPPDGKRSAVATLEPCLQADHEALGRPSVTTGRYSHRRAEPAPHGEHP